MLVVVVLLCPYQVVVLCVVVKYITTTLYNTMLWLYILIGVIWISIYLDRKQKKLCNAPGPFIWPVVGYLPKLLWAVYKYVLCIVYIVLL